MAVESITLVTAIVGTATGLAGTIFGLVNTWQLLQRKQLRLKVTPYHTIGVGSLHNSPYNFGIEVINLSEFAVTVTDVGLYLRDKRRATFLTVQGIERGGSLPLRLEPRTSYSKIFRLAPDVLDLKLIKTAYVSTQCGVTIRGTSPALQQVIQKGSGE